MNPRVVVVGERALLGARTKRSLARFGIASNEDDPNASTWIVRAGAWIFARPEIAPSATKKPLLAIGAIYNDSSWDDLAARTKGELRHASDVSSVRVASVLVESPSMARDVLAHASLDEIVWKNARAADVRAVRAHALDVGFDERLRVCVAITALRRGGAERIAIDHVNALRARGVAVKLVVMGKRDDAAYDAPEDTVYDVRRVAALAEVANAFGADVIHTHLFDADDVRALAALGPPVVVTVHNDRARWVNGFDAVTCEEAALTLGCSQKTTRALAAEMPRVRASPNCVDRERVRGGARESTRRALEIPHGALVVSCVANPRPQKRLELAVETLAALRKTRDAVLVIAGDAIDAEGDRALRSAIASSKMERFVRLIGSQRDVRDLYAATDVLLTTSTYEGMSVAQLEALAASIPIVTTDVGGARELARTHENYFIADASPDALASAIHRALTSTRSRLSPLFYVENAAARHERALRGAALFDHAEDGLVLVINNFSTGGAQASAKRLLLNLAARGHRVACAVLQEQLRFPSLWREEVARHVPVFVAPHRNDAAASAASVCDFVRSRRASTVVFWNVMTSHKLRIADELVGVRLFDVSPGEMYFSALDRYFEKPEADNAYFEARDYGALLEGVVVKFSAEASRARDALGAPVHVVPNGVPLRDTKSKKRGDRFVIGTLARISPDKKLEELVDAARVLARSQIPHEIRVAGRTERGADEYAARIRESARDLPITFCGELDASQFLDELDAFVMVSEPEGCPNALLEAMSASLPIAATNVGGAAEAITDGETGLLTPRGDGTALGHALVRLATDSRLASTLATNAHERIRQRYDVERMTSDYEALFFTKR